jgi:hypothetical protein
MWPHDDFPTENGGHTYMGFITIMEKKWYRKGIVKPVPIDNFQLLSNTMREGFKKGFLEKGYVLLEK